MAVRDAKRLSPAFSLAIAAAVFAALAGLTGLVWRDQVRHQHSLLAQRTGETSAQAARRLEVFMTSHLRMASVFARRWSTHEQRDFSRTRFTEFAAVLMEEIPGYYAIGLMPPERRPGFVVPPEVPLFELLQDPEHLPTLDRVARERKPALSAPFESVQGATTVFAALPLLRGEEFLGYLLVDFRTGALIDDCFHERIRSEFHFSVQDGEKIIFRSSAQATAGSIARSRTLSRVEVSVLDRTWLLSMAPREEVVKAYGWKASLALPLLGLLLSVVLGVLVFLLLRRMEMFRAARDQQARLSGKVLLAQEEERARISRELHDELGQQLTALRLELGWLQRRIPAESAAEAGAFKNAVLLVEQATEELRRMCRGLRPPLLDDLGLEPAVRHLVEDFRGRSAGEVEVDISLDDKAGSVSAPLALCAYRILQESLTNIGRHAQASRIDIKLWATPEDLTLQISDNGKGFDTGRLGAMRGWGLQGMQERANLVEGTVEIQSVREEGTRVFFRAPLRPGGKEQRA